MIILKSQPDCERLTITSVRRNFRVRIRKEELEKMFANFRQSAIQNKNARQNQIPLPIFPIVFSPQAGAPFVNPTPQQINNYWPVIARYIQPSIQREMLYPRVIPLQAPLPLPPIPQAMMPPQQKISKVIIKMPLHEVYFEKGQFTVYKKQIGSGSFSKVWQGFDKETNQRIAVKEVKQLEQNEVKCLTELDSPHIIKIFSIHKSFSKSFIFLELCDRNLKEELNLCSYDLSTSLSYFEQIVAGMDQLQSRNILHRDLKFQNILVKNRQIKIADFGLAKFMGDELEIQSKRCGTPYTMAPEIYFSKTYKTPYTIKSDIWSLGILLHEMLYQQHPFGGNKQNFKKEKRIPVARKFGVLDRLVDKCLVFDPQFRVDWDEFKVIFMEYINLKRGGWTQANAYSSMENYKAMNEQKRRIGRAQESKKEVSPQGRMDPRRFALEAESKKETPPKNFKKVKRNNQMQAEMPLIKVVRRVSPYQKKEKPKVYEIPRRQQLAIPCPKLVRNPDPIDQTANKYNKKPSNPLATPPTVPSPFQYYRPPVQKITFPQTQMTYSRIFWEIVLVLVILTIIYQIY